MIEKEYKVLIEQKQYEKIVKQFEFAQPFIQINFYYKEKQGNYLDTTIRVRAIKERINLQVKELISRDNGTCVRKEYQKRLETVPHIIEGQTLNELCKNDKYQDCFLMGMLITERRIAQIEDCEIALDINHYCGITDYELEVEFDKEISPNILKILRQERLYKKENAKAKYERFVTQILKTM